MLVAEGVGGLLVPLTADDSVRDLAVALGCRSSSRRGPGLGTINHTLLTLEAARAAGLTVAGVVLTPWPAAPDAMVRSNRATIARLGAVDVATLPRAARRLARRARRGRSGPPARRMAGTATLNGAPVPS